MRLAETFGGTLLSLFVDLKMRTSKACLVQMMLQRGAFEYAGGDPVLHLQDRDDLVHRPGRDFPPQLDSLLQEFIIVLREISAVPRQTVSGF